MNGCTRVGQVRWVCGIVVAGLMLAWSAPVWSADETAAVSVEVRGVRVVGPGYGSEGEELRPFNWSKGVTLALLVSVPEGGIIEFDDEACEVTKLVDDKGTDLFVPATFSSPGFSSFDSVSADGKAVLVELNGGGIPAKGAKSITAKGTMAIRAGKSQKSYKAENVPVKMDAKVEAGDIPMVITTVGKPDWGDNPLRISLQATQDVSNIARIRFLDADGTEIESSQSGRMSMSSFDSVQVTTDYDLAKKVETVTVEVTYWTDLRTLKIPFDLTVPAGL